MDVLNQIKAYNAGREPERLRLKYRAMRQSTSAFLRGSCHLFYDGLPRAGIMKSAPLTWVCGDLHVENFGSYKGDNRLVYFDINDFDEAALAPASWDLLRMLTSLRVTSQGLGLSRADSTALSEGFLGGYRQALQAGKAYWVEREIAHGLVRALLDGLRQRQRADLLAARTVRKGRQSLLRVDGKRALPATLEQRELISQFIPGIPGLAAPEAHPDFFRVLDVARRIAGTGSLGLDRYVILVQGKGGPDGHYLLDLKQARPSTLAPHLVAQQPRWKTEAQRVVTLQQRLQAVPMAFLRAVRLGDRSYVLRALQPTEDRIVLTPGAHTPASLAALSHAMGEITAWSQLRSAGRSGSADADELIAFGQRQKWPLKLLDLADHCAEQVNTQAEEFNRAYDGGILDV